MSELPSGTVTFLFTDIEGSTRLLKRLREGYAQVLAEHQELLQAAFSGHGGMVVDTQGDAFFVVFRRALDAVEAALAGQRSLQAHVWPAGVEVRVRMGVHTGQAEASGGRYHGLAVHRAARIGAAAHGGQVLVSQTTRDLLDDEEEESAGVSLRDLGEQRLKDLDRPVRLYQLEAAGLVGEFPGLRMLESEPEPRESRAVTAGRSGWRSRRLLAAGVLVAIGVAVALVLVIRGGAGSAQASTIAADSVGVFQAGDGNRVAQVPVRARPNSVASGAGSVWVTNTDDDSVSRINPVTRAVVQLIQVGSEPAGVVVGGGFIWVANSGAGTVSKIDPRANSGSGGVVNTIPVGNEPSGVAFGLGSVWVANVFDRTVTPIDASTGAVGRPIGVGTGADGIAVGAGALWVTSEAAGTVTRIDPRTGAKQPIGVGSGPTAVAYGDGSVWVTNSQAGTVSRINPASNQVVWTIPVGDGPSGISVAGDVVWVSNELAGTLSRIGAAQNKVVQTVSTGNRPQGVSVTANSMYVAVRSSGVAHRGGTLTDAVTSIGPEADAVNPERGYDAWGVLSLTNDGLIGYRRVGGIGSARLVPDLATAIPASSNGGTTYTFQLRRGLRYANGQLVRPADFQRAIERALTTKSSNGVPQYYGGIVGAAACVKTPTRCDLSRGIATDASANTVTFNLAAPDPDFLDKLALPMADAVPTDTPLDAHRPLPATGPYMIASYDTKRAIRLVRNPRFHVWSELAQPNGYPNEIVFELFKSGDATVRAVEQQRADVTDAGPFGISEALRAALLNGPYASQLHSSPGNATGYIALNTRIPPFNDIKVRQAINYAVDRNLAVAANGGTALSQPTCQVLPPNFDGYRPYCPYTIDPSADGTYRGPDLTKARRLVAASGTKGQTVLLWIATCCVKLGPADVVSALRRLGYNARLKVNNRLYNEAGDSRLRAQAVATFWGADYPSAADFFSPLLTCASFRPRTSGQGNLAELCNRHIDAEIAQARALQTNNPQAASLLWTKIDRDVTRQAPWVSLTSPRVDTFVSRRVGNYQYSVWVNLLDQLWVH